MRSNLALALAVGLALASTATAAPLGKSKEGAKPAPTAASAAAAPPTLAPHVGASAIPATFTLPGVPAWQPPAEYSVDMVMSSGDQTVTMHRIFRNGSIRSDIAAEGETMAMIEKAEEPGTTYTLMPSQKMAMKMSAADVNPELPKAAKKHRLDPDPEPEAQPEIEKLGTETIDGHAATKFKVTAGEHHALMWFDTGTGAPLRMESEGSKIEWKNLEVKSQPASLFEVPKGYQVTDMGEMQKKMQAAMAQGGMAMGGAGLAGRSGAGAAMSALGAGGGLPGGGTSLEGMAGGYGQQMGQNFGQQIGSGIGASFGGPIGAMAGSYIGGKVGGWLGHRVATAVTPDIGPGSSK
jgi:hypothetical protein